MDIKRTVAKISNHIVSICGPLTIFVATTYLFCASVINEFTMKCYPIRCLLFIIVMTAMIDFVFSARVETWYGPTTTKKPCTPRGYTCKSAGLQCCDALECKMEKTRIGARKRCGGVNQAPSANRDPSLMNPK